MATGSFFGCWRDGYLQIAGINLSDHAKEISLEKTVAELPNNAHGDTVAKVNAGLESWTVNVTFLQDFAAAKVDATLASIGGAGHTPFNVVVGADATSVVSATNPRYSGLMIMSNYRPMGGPHGANLEATATFRAAGSNLNRQVTP